VVPRQPRPHHRVDPAGAHHRLAVHARDEPLDRLLRAAGHTGPGPAGWARRPGAGPRAADAVETRHGGGTSRSKAPEVPPAAPSATPDKGARPDCVYWQHRRYMGRVPSSMRRFRCNSGPGPVRSSCDAPFAGQPASAATAPGARPRNAAVRASRMGATPRIPNLTINGFRYQARRGV
jgi:hypothetical protein